MKKRAIFYFGDVVVDANGNIGCICKTWGPSSVRNYYKYEVYLRPLNAIVEIRESRLQRFILSKSLTDEEKMYHANIDGSL